MGVGGSIKLAAQIAAISGTELALEYLYTTDSFRRALIVRLSELTYKEVEQRDRNLAVEIAKQVSNLFPKKQK